jgi:WhiB family redox-sensing transcriptional regulator
MRGYGTRRPAQPLALSAHGNECGDLGVNRCLCRYHLDEHAGADSPQLQLPNLEGAACAGRSDLFDLVPSDSAERAHSEARALAICARCTVLGACRAWFASLPAAQRPVGVIAGRVHRPRGPRPKWSR